jgi:hypothetical protein
MRIRIFRATGEEEISQLETQINNWASSKLDKAGREIIHSSTTMAAISEQGVHPSVIVTLWVDGNEDV